MYANDLPLARKMLDQAFLSSNSVTVASKKEIKATSISGSESNKLFKGEPHERSIVSLFRGLLYLADEDIENANACFKTGALQDALASDEKMRSNWLSLDLLLLESKRIYNSEDAQEWSSYVKQRYEQEALPVDWEKIRSVSVIILIGVGNSPEKLAGKSKGEELQYLERKSRVRKIKVWSGPDKQLVYSVPVDDCYIQAVTRGRRKMDEVLAHKASAKKGIEAVGSVAAAAAPLTVYGAIPLALIKEMTWSISDRIDSSADIRQMRMIPGEIYLALLDGAEIGDPLHIELFSEEDRKLAEGNISCRAPSNQKVRVLLARFPY
jgi:hypothetical protein